MLCFSSRDRSYFSKRASMFLVLSFMATAFCSSSSSCRQCNSHDLYFSLFSYFDMQTLKLSTLSCPCLLPPFGAPDFVDHNHVSLRSRSKYLHYTINCSQYPAVVGWLQWSSTHRHLGEYTLQVHSSVTACA